MIHLLVFFSILISVHGYLIFRPQNSSTLSHFEFHQEVLKNVGQPLYLTPLLEKDDIRKAQKMSTVHLPDFEDIKSYSGYFTVNKKCESNLFFWFFPAQDNWQSAPVVLWLQGGPGVSSLFGLFTELGPISFKSKLEKRRYSWNVKNNLLFIDQPVGTGFSFTRGDCYATNETEVSRDVYSALIQFYQMFPSLKNNKFYATGESYGGHYVPALAHAIHKNNPSAKIKINLSGAMVGNGWMDAVYQSDYSSYLYQLGLVDNHQRDLLRRMEKKLEEHLKKGYWKTAVDLSEKQLKTVQIFIGNISIYNFLEGKHNQRNAPDPWEKFVTSTKFQKTLHVGDIVFGSESETVNNMLATDSVQSVKSTVEELLEHYPIVFYHGQLDIICAYPMAVNFFRNLDWSGTRDYLKAERQHWCVENQLAGYYKSGHNLHEVLVRAAGHMVPSDQPLWAFELVNSVTSSPSHDPLQKLRSCG